MIYNKSIYEPVESKYSSKRMRNRREIDNRREEIYAKIPRVKEIEAEIEKTGLKLVQIALNSAQNAEAAVGAAEAHNKALIKEKKELLEKAGYTQDYMKNVYDCPKCMDTGYIDGVICSCFRKELIKEACKRSNLAPALYNCTFDKFNISYYQNRKDEEGENPRKQITYILDCCYNFMNNFNRGGNKNLLFYGSTGLGKTFLTAAIASQLIEKGYTIMYYTAKQLFEMLTENAFKSSMQEESRWAYDVDLLIIDDLGSEHITSYTVASFFDILNVRMMAGKQIIINTNLDIDGLSTVYSARIFSRLTEFEILKFIGEDIRALKNHI